MKSIAVFLIVSILALLVIPIQSYGQNNQTAQEQVTLTEDKTTLEEASVSPDRKLIAYYFHGKKRCMSCRAIEMYTHDALLTHFPDELENGRIDWQIVNYANPKFAHFKEDFGLYIQSVVLVDVQSDTIKSWKNLADVWKLIRKKEAFYEYIREEVEAYLPEK